MNKKTILNTDVVGTVSQSGGIPTGAIMESGSNANGRYIKFSDGTLMQWMEISQTLTIDGGAVSSLLSKNFPIPFLEAPHNIETALVSDYIFDYLFGIEVFTSTGISVAYIKNFSATSRTQTFRVFVHAVGRWY